MGFIYGIIHFDNQPVQKEEIEKLGKSVGWENFVRQTYLRDHIALGFCYHPDRKPKAGYYNDNGLTVLADIRIYNSDVLKQSFDYQTPEEALAKAYQLWGTNCADHINGDFAAFIFDHHTQQAHLFRDHIGARPLVFWFSEKKLIFASHEYGLTKSRLFSTSLSEKKFIDQLLDYRGSYGQTVFSDIKNVLPGYCNTFSVDCNYLKTKYWKPEAILKDNTLTFDAAVNRLRKLLFKATCRRMEQVKTGMHVSGGLDSCGVASIVADQAPDKKLLTGYTLTPEVFEGPVEGVNEKEFIEAFSIDKNIKVKYLNLKNDERVKDSIQPEFPVQHIEHSIMKMASMDGLELLFSGWGGDEFVSLSTRGTINHLFFRFKWGQLLKYTRAKGLKNLICQFRTDVFPLLIPFGLLPVYKTGKKNRSILLCLMKPAFIKKHFRKIFFNRQKNIFSFGNRKKFVLNLLYNYHLPERMDSWAINAERYGFEYKYPLLDKEVLEFWFSLPIEYTYKDFYPRLLYREAMKGFLTEKIRTRKDKGEAVRIASSFRENQDGKKYLEQLFDSFSKREHLPFVNPEKVRDFFSDYDSEKKLKRIKAIGKTTLYLRYVNLFKTYLSDHNLTNTL